MPGNTPIRFLDRLELVAGNPLVYVAFLLLAAGWFGSWFYFTSRRSNLKALKLLPEGERLTFMQMVLLGLPKTVTSNRIKVLRWRVMLIAYGMSLVALLVLAGLGTYYLTLPAAEVAELAPGES